MRATHSSLGKILLFIIHEMYKFIFFFLRHSFDSCSDAANGVKVAILHSSNGSIVNYITKGFVYSRLLLPLWAVSSNMSLKGTFEAPSFLSMFLFLSFSCGLSYGIDIHGIRVEGRGTVRICLSSLSSIPREGFSLHLVVLPRGRWGIAS